MTQQRSPQPSPGQAPEAVKWNDLPGTWLALAVMFLALSVSPWIEALRGEGALSVVAAAAFTLTAVLFTLHARRCARRRDSAAGLG